MADTATPAFQAAAEKTIDGMIAEEFDSRQLADIRDNLEVILACAKAQSDELYDLVKDVDFTEPGSLSLRAKASTLSRVLKGRVKACERLLNEDWGKI